MDELHRLSIVSKVTTELENHVGVSDKDLAEFVISMAAKSATRARLPRGAARQRRRISRFFHDESLQYHRSHAGRRARLGERQCGHVVRVEKTQKRHGAHARRRFGRRRRGRFGCHANQRNAPRCWPSDFRASRSRIAPRSPTPFDDDALAGNSKNPAFSAASASSA
jgi:hypothetical protein